MSLVLLGMYNVAHPLATVRSGLRLDAIPCKLLPNGRLGQREGLFNRDGPGVAAGMSMEKTRMDEEGVEWRPRRRRAGVDRKLAR
jgi:hypothetical protein